MYQDDYLITSRSFRPRNSKQFFEDHKKSYKWRLENLPNPQWSRFEVCPSLTILIPSCKKHEEFTKLLCKELRRQGLEYIVDSREGVDLGTKRQDLYKQCESVYCIQWDADDFIHSNFSSIVAPYLKLSPNVDCINFIEHVVMHNQTTITRRSIHFPPFGMMMGSQYCFSPSPKSIIRTELARRVVFEKGKTGEDLAFARDLRPLLKTEINIDEILYYYEYCDDGSCTQTNSQVNIERRANGAAYNE